MNTDPFIASLDDIQTSITDALAKCVNLARKDVSFTEAEKLRESAQLLRVANDRIDRIKRTIMEDLPE